MRFLPQRALVAAGLLLAVTPGSPGATELALPNREARLDTLLAKGTFEVTVSPDSGGPPGLGRMTLAKSFGGDLLGTSRGTMLTWRDEETGSAAYVAIERVTGTLSGARGSFVLTHRGTMTPDAQELTIYVAPGSGTEELAGLSGAMSVRIDAGVHYYEFRYELP